MPGGGSAFSGKRLPKMLHRMKRDTIYTQVYESPCGTLLLGSFGERLCLCDWAYGRKHGQTRRRLERDLRACFKDEESAVTNQAAKELDEYFSGERKSFDIPLLFCGTDFQKTVWESLSRTGYGTTCSYSQLSADIGRPFSVRAVGNAVGTNSLSIFVPCHRIIGQSQQLTGYNGGLQAKRFLLALEARQLQAQP